MASQKQKPYYDLAIVSRALQRGDAQALYASAKSTDVGSTFFV